MSDLIDRQAAIDAVKAMEDTSGKGEIAGFYNMILEHVIDKLIALSSAQPEILARGEGELIAQPERKKGQWIPQDHNKINGMTSTAVYYYPKCSVCGYSAYPTNFCPNCGADMRGEQDE